MIGDSGEGSGGGRALPADVAAAVLAEAGGDPPDLVRQRVLARLRQSTAAAAAAAVALSASAAAAAVVPAAAAGDGALGGGPAGAPAGAANAAGVGAGSVAVAGGRLVGKLSASWLGKTAVLVSLVGAGAGLHALLRSPPPSPAAIGGSAGGTDVAPDSSDGRMMRPLRRSVVGGGRWLGPGPAEAAGGGMDTTADAAPRAALRRHRGRASLAGRLAAERALLDRARRALARSDGDGALVPLARHASGFPRGQLVEEREGMWVKALVLAGRPAEARARAESFRHRFPHSLFRPAVDAALRSARHS